MDRGILSGRQDICLIYLLFNVKKDLDLIFTNFKTSGNWNWWFIPLSHLLAIVAWKEIIFCWKLLFLFFLFPFYINKPRKRKIHLITYTWIRNGLELAIMTKRLKNVTRQPDKTTTTNTLKQCWCIPAFTSLPNLNVVFRRSWFDSRSVLTLSTHCSAAPWPKRYFSFSFKL